MAAFRISLTCIISVYVGFRISGHVDVLRLRYLCRETVGASKAGGGGAGCCDAYLHPPFGLE